MAARTTQSPNGGQTSKSFALSSNGLHLSIVYPGATPETPVSTIWVRNQLLHVTSKIVKGKAKLPVHHHEVGTHSISAGATMAMYLGGVPVFAIMLIGCWSSTAFMNYIQKQIEEFTFNVSTSMLTMQLSTCPKRITMPEKEGIWRLGQHDACSEDGVGIKLGQLGPGEGQTFY